MDMVDPAQIEGSSVRFTKASHYLFKVHDSNGYVTRNDLSLAQMPNVIQKNHPHPAVLYQNKPQLEPYIHTNPSVLHQQLITTNQKIHHPKFYNERRDLKPEYPKAPNCAKVLWIRPDENRFMQQGWRNGPIYPRGCQRLFVKYPPLISEMKDKYAYKWVGGSTLYGGPTVYTLKREVFTRPQTLFSPTYVEDDIRHPMYYANPYKSTSHMAHRNFEDDLFSWEHLKGRDQDAHHPKDVAIKSRVRPMHDSFENTRMYLEGRQLPLDYDICAHGSSSALSNRKLLFNTVAYQGNPPRSFQPVNFLCNQSTYQGSYLKPFARRNIVNQFRMLEPKYKNKKLEFRDVLKTPEMYIAESKDYGSGKLVGRLQGNLRHTQIKKLGRVYR